MAAERHRSQTMTFGIVSGGIAMRTNLPETIRRQRGLGCPRLRFVRGIPRAPSAQASPPYSNSEGGKARAMERHPKQIHVRMSEDEIERAKRLAADTGMTLSDLIRVLLQIPATSVGEGGRLIVIDRTTAAKLTREMRRWGHHYNQAVHALNAIAYYLRANDMDTPDVLEELDRAAGKLAAMQPGVEALCRSVEDVSGSVIAALGR